MFKKSWVSVFIFINSLVFLSWYLLESASPGSFMYRNFLVSWTSVVQGRVWTLLFSVFSHISFLHFFLNMFVLRSFGPVLERVLGGARFVRFYLVAGVLSSLSHILVSKFIMNKASLPALGASGAISALIMLFSMLFPKQKMLIFGIIPVPAIIGAFIFVGLDLWGLLAQSTGGGLPIGHGAHLGGALCGFLYYFNIRNHSKVW